MTESKRLECEMKVGVRPGLEDQMGDVVLIAVDASTQAEESFNFYLNNLHRPSNRLVLLHIVELPDLYHAREAHLSPTTLFELWEQEKTKSKALKEHFEETIKKLKVIAMGATFRTENGVKPGEIIVSIATAENATMIVMGTRGMGAIRRTILGSVSDYVMHHSACPVIICRQKEDHDKHHVHHAGTPATNLG